MTHPSDASLIDPLFTELWKDYVQITPSALAIQQLFQKEQRAPIQNDHIALRTFKHDKVRLHTLAQHFIHLGYTVKGDYVFPQKHLNAHHFEHPSIKAPKVFISELNLNPLSPQSQRILQRCIDHIDPQAPSNTDFLWSGRHWPINQRDYNQLLSDSEYAAWMYVWGFRANHFTISVNHLEHFTTLADVNEALKANGHTLNTAGGEIKGSAHQGLEQSSTLADRQTVMFDDGERVIPSCFYECAQRHPLNDGTLFNGFIEGSADKIFESTNANI